MGLPVFVGAGSGAERLTTGTTTASKTGCTAGNLILMHLYVNGTSGDWTGWSNSVNLENLAGVDNNTTNIDGTVDFQLNCARVIANGTVSSDFGPGASGEAVAARLYEFSGCATGTTFATVFESNTDSSGTATTAITDADCTTTAANQLALNFVGLKSAQAIGPFTGETGGDWVEAVAEYVATTLTLQLQIANLVSAGTISGGSVTVGSNTTFYNNGKSLRAGPDITPGPGDNPPIGFSGRGAGW